MTSQRDVKNETMESDVQ